MNSTLCWIEGVGLWLLILLSYALAVVLLVSVIFLIVFGIGKAIGKATQRTVERLRVRLERPVRIVGISFVWIVVFAFLAAITVASKESVCRSGFWKSYSSAMRPENAHAKAK